MACTCVKINLIALRTRLSKEQGGDVDPAEVGRWLAQKGFAPNNGDWHCDSRSVYLLRPNEILARRDLDDENGVFFVSPENRDGPRTG